MRNCRSPPRLLAEREVLLHPVRSAVALNLFFQAQLQVLIQSTQAGKLPSAPPCATGAATLAIVLEVWPLPAVMALGAAGARSHPTALAGIPLVTNKAPRISASPGIQKQGKRPTTAFLPCRQRPALDRIPLHAPWPGPLSPRLPGRPCFTAGHGWGTLLPAPCPSAWALSPHHRLYPG